MPKGKLFLRIPKTKPADSTSAVAALTGERLGFQQPLAAFRAVCRKTLVITACIAEKAFNCLGSKLIRGNSPPLRFLLQTLH